MKYEDIPDSFFRVSVKALVFNEEGRFLLTQEDDGCWELPGGGLDFGETPQQGLAREIDEEMSLKVASIAEHPSYFFTFEAKDFWRVNVVYVAKLASLDFTPSSECRDIKFFSQEEASAIKDKLHINVQKFIGLYDPKKHIS